MALETSKSLSWLDTISFDWYLDEAKNNLDPDLLSYNKLDAARYQAAKGYVSAVSDTVKNMDSIAISRYLWLPVNPISNASDIPGRAGKNAEWFAKGLAGIFWGLVDPVYTKESLPRDKENSNPSHNNLDDPHIDLNASETAKKELVMFTKFLSDFSWEGADETWESILVSVFMQYFKKNNTNWVEADYMTHFDDKQCNILETAIRDANRKQVELKRW